MNTQFTGSGHLSARGGHQHAVRHHGVGRCRAPGARPAPSVDGANVAIEDQLHAIRSGLAGLAGAMHVLADRETVVPDDSRRRLESMLVAEIERLQRLVAVPGSAAEAGDAELLDLDEVIEAVVLARTSAGQQVLWTPSGHRVRGQRDELVEVLNILLVNAARHAGTAVRIDVVEDGGQVRLSVSDRGPGVPVAFRQEIFERGARRDDSPGQGLGLSIARDLVEDLGGTLVLDAARERGARFEVVLPAIELGGAA
jgi:signal transduction histidine kinase